MSPGHVTAMVLLPMRLFVGVTFLYAGLQKFSDPQFFSPTAPGFIGRQMSGFVHAGSPLSPLLTHLAIPHAAPCGALIALGEMLIGISTLAGLLARAGALGGLLLSLTLYLTASWTVHPYFLGADLPYALAWLTLLLAGPGPWSLDEYFFGTVLRARAAAHPVLSRRGRAAVHAPLPLAEDPVARRAFLGGLGSATVLATGGLFLGALVKLRTPNRVFAGATPALPAATPAPAASAAPVAPAGMTFLGNVRVLAPNTAGQYTDPISGDPALLVHLPNGRFVAYDAVCTHAGCTVEYDPTQHELVCPCHGAVYDPAQGAQVLAGPAPQPLATLQVTIDTRGNAFAKGVAGSNASTAPAPQQGGEN
jgi:thiosulfate dehydrogenase [quinone] large subunit